MHKNAAPRDNEELGPGIWLKIQIHQDLVCESIGIPSQSNDFTATVPEPKSYENYVVKIHIFMYWIQFDATAVQLCTLEY